MLVTKMLFVQYMDVRPIVCYRRPDTDRQHESSSGKSLIHVAHKMMKYSSAEPFPGRIGRTLEHSEPAWPAQQLPPKGAPNIVVIVLDDVGFGQLSAFGGPCQVPAIDRLAREGIVLANFQTTALCSPTRASLLTGRNHHSVGMSAITELSLGFPAHNARIGPEHGMLPEALRAVGYNTFCVGKWHLTPPEETTMAGPFDRWPLGRGFERFYGFLGGDTDQYHPELVYDNHPVRASATPEQGYHLNADLADHAIAFIADAHAVAPDKPFLLWYATGAGHAPHQVEPQWMQSYRGAFDEGWDTLREQVFTRQIERGLLPDGAELSVRDPDVEDWASLSADARSVYARQMEVYAGFLSQTDHHIGRVLGAIEDMGELDNTIVVCLSDNGASAEGRQHGTLNSRLFMNMVPEHLEDNLAAIDDWGGPDTFSHYAWGWAWAGNTPFRRWKRETYRGGVGTPCIMSWPAGLRSAGGVRNQYLHAIDILPTLLDLVGINPPESLNGVKQSPIHGVSAATVLRDRDAPEVHRTQYFEMGGHRAIYHDGWKAVCPYPAPSLAEGRQRGLPYGTPLTEAVLQRLDAHHWELYHLESDPSETRDLAADHPGTLDELKALWWSQATTFGVLPLAAAGIQRLMTQRPATAQSREVFELRPGGAPIAFAAAPRVVNRAHTITARVHIPEEGAEGILLSQGNRHGGYALYLAGGRLRFTHNYLGLQRFSVIAREQAPTGEHTLQMRFTPTGEPDFPRGRGCPASIVLYCDHVAVGEGALPFTVPVLFATSGLSCGIAHADTVDPSIYAAPFPFTGDLHKVILDLTGDQILYPPAELARLSGEQ